MGMVALGDGRDPSGPLGTSAKVIVPWLVLLLFFLPPLLPPPPRRRCRPPLLPWLLLLLPAGILLRFQSRKDQLLHDVYCFWSHFEPLRYPLRCLHPRLLQRSQRGWLRGPPDRGGGSTRGQKGSKV